MTNPARRHGGISPLPASHRARASAVLLAVLAVAVAAPAAAARGPLTRLPVDPDRHERRLAASPGSAVVPGAVDRTSIRLAATYDVRARLLYGAGTLAATTSIGLTNTSGGPIDRVELNLVPLRLGSARVTSVFVDDRAVTPTASDQTLTVPLGGVLPAGATARLRVTYDSRFRTTTGGSDWLFTKRDGIVDAYRWIPWVSRRIPFGRDNHGDPFVTPTASRVTVAFTSDRTLVYATSGRRTGVSGLTQTFTAENVRDFNFTASPYYRVRTATIGDTRVRIVFRSGAPVDALLSTTRRAFERLEALVGPYPWPTFDVAHSAGGFGMESPGLIWIPPSRFGSRLAYSVTHEVAHQWFYAAVGNDQAYQPYADEAIADFLTREIIGGFRASECARSRLDLAIYEYTRACYYEIVYIQGGLLLRDLRARMGSTAFWEAIRDYYRSQRFRLSSTRTLLDTLDAHTSKDLSTTYAPRFPRYY